MSESFVIGLLIGALLALVLGVYVAGDEK